MDRPTHLVAYCWVELFGDQLGMPHYQCRHAYQAVIWVVRGATSVEEMENKSCYEVLYRAGLFPMVGVIYESGIV